MTIKQWSLKYLTDRGMFPEQAEESFRRNANDPANEAMEDRWNDDVEGYPSQLRAVLALSLNWWALQYIDETCPQAWFRPMFTGNPEAEIARLSGE